MSFEEWCSKNHLYEQDNLKACWDAAQTEMKERCAKVCEELESAIWLLKDTPYWSLYNSGISDGAGECADAIRALDTKEK